MSYSVNNAGLVILQAWTRTLFARLGLTEQDRFVDGRAQGRAVHYLQFLVTGQEEAAERFLLLNKLLCGLLPDAPVESGIDMSAQDRAICLGLLEAVMAYWPECGKGSVEALRQNWLLREGVLNEQDHNWSLAVERRAYDVLLSRSPFTYAVVKLPWMKKPVYVSWPA